MSLLRYACTQNSDSLITGDVTGLTCRDANRLELERVGITADSLCINAARKDANRRKAPQRALAWMARYERYHVTL